MKKTLFAFMALAATFAATSCQSDEEFTQQPTDPPTNGVTTGIAKATIDGKQVDVKWVQLWADGPKFAEYNVGATSATDQGTTMSFGEATNADADYVWGSNWCTPSKKQMEELLQAATPDGSTKVVCIYTEENGVYGFKFTGKGSYTDNSVFFPAQNYLSYYGDANYWSATDNSSEAWDMALRFSVNDWFSCWLSYYQNSTCLVRPVLRN